MNKEMQVRALSQKFGVTLKDAKEMYEKFAEFMKESIDTAVNTITVDPETKKETRGKFKYSDIMVFEARDVAKREFCNPKNREEKVIKEAYTKVVVKMVGTRSI